MSSFKPTLGQVFVGSLLGLAAVLALLFFLVFNASRAASSESSESIRDGASRDISNRVVSFLAAAPATVQRFQSEIGHGIADPGDPLAVETALLSLLAGEENLAEISFTYGTQSGFDESGNIQLAESPRGEWSVARSGTGKESRMWSRHIQTENGRFVAERRVLENGSPLRTLAWEREAGPAPSDPTAQLTFTTPARKDLFGELVWSDLHWLPFEANLPAEQRRVEVSVQQVIIDAAGKFLGVLRVGLLTEQLDRAVQVRIASEGEDDPHRIFICDAQRRLVTRVTPTDRVVEFADALRIDPKTLPREITHAMAVRELHMITPDRPSFSGLFEEGGREFLTTFRALPESQEWIVGIVVPRAHYLGKLTAMRDRLLIILLIIMVLLLGGGGLILRGVKRGQAQIGRESMKMNAFEFSPAPTASAFRDVSAVLESLEKAKTAMRAMGKYVPIDLVRRLYQARSEPVLGGELTEVSIMFTDIQDFTTLSERLTPNALAEALGRYLAVMARIIAQDNRGTIDKYIGDAIMTIWNAPEPVAGHVQLACRAALQCRDASRALSQSPEWGGLPPFETRFGLHKDTAMVGHFGSPDRMNYTAIGDAINLASRLEGLNKQYGTSIIASQSVFAEARDQFAFRLLDVVAVKGKSEAIRIYELLGKSEDAEKFREVTAAYESAFHAYAARDFTAAIETLRSRESDPPSAILLERCLSFQKEPPPADWDGVYVSKAK